MASLSQLRDPIGTEGQVTQSVATLMANHRSDLKIPFFHMVFTVPPWLKLKLTAMTDIRMIYNVKMWKNDEKRTRNGPGRRIMQKRRRAAIHTGGNGTLLWQADQDGNLQPRRQTH